MIVKCYVAAGGIALNLRILLDIGVGGEAFIYIKLFLMVKKHLGVLFFRPKKGGINVSGYNNQQMGIIKCFFQANLLVQGRCIPT